MAGEATATINLSGTIAGIKWGGTVSNPAGESPFGFERDLGVVTNLEIDLDVDISELKVIVIEANKDCTVLTNSTSVPDDTLAPKANKPMFWESGRDPASALFLGADVTKLYVTTTVATHFKVAGLQNVTPGG